jgi:hypothetical protein
VRGADSRFEDIYNDGQGPSPRAQGRLRDRARQARGDRTIPACAGPTLLDLRLLPGDRAVLSSPTQARRSLSIASSIARRARGPEIVSPPPYGSRCPSASRIGGAGSRWSRIRWSGSGWTRCGGSRRHTGVVDATCCWRTCSTPPRWRNACGTGFCPRRLGACWTRSRVVRAGGSRSSPGCAESTTTGKPCRPSSAWTRSAPGWCGRRGCGGIAIGSHGDGGDTTRPGRCSCVASCLGRGGRRSSSTGCGRWSPGITARSPGSETSI